ncbi:unnamed protein product [Durusdinium trenchii]|uniref:C3H1-type domain-containing protein n=1 Tax=Durusdinium trenchii TaxID=1381693 RepID=A0ABP0HZG7_9DINO
MGKDSKDTKEKQDEWELLNRLSAKELRILAARKCVPLTQISTAVEKIDLINLIVKAGPVLDQYDVSVGVKVWTAESIENHQPGEKKAKAKKKEKKEKKEKALALEDKKRKKGSSDSDAPKVPKDKKRSPSRKKGSRSPSLTMMLPAEAPAQVSNPEAAMKALLPPSSRPAPPKALPAAKVPAGTVEDLDLDDDEVVACEAPPKVAEAAVAVRAGTAEAAPKRRRAVEIQVVEVEDGKDEEAKDRRRRARKEKEAKEKEAKESEAKEKDLKEAEAKEKEVKEKELKEKEAKEKEAKEKELKEKELSEKETKEKEGKEKVPTDMSVQAKPKNTAQAGVAAAAALGFDVLPKQSSFVPPTAPALGLRPSINAPIPLPANSNPTQSRVCVQYLCWARCDRGSNCPEAHIMDPEEEMRVRAKFKLQECNQGASCTRTSCLFRHPGEHVEEASLGAKAF